MVGGSRDFDEKVCGGGAYMGSWDECSASDAVGLGNTCVSYLGGFRLGRRDVTIVVLKGGMARWCGRYGTVWVHWGSRRGRIHEERSMKDKREKRSADRLGAAQRW